MMKKKPIASADIILNKDFFRMTTMSNGGMSYGDPDAPRHYLLPDVNNSTLGATLRLALKASKTVTPAEFVKIFKSGIVQQRAKEAIRWEMEHYGYKTEKTMYKNMSCCSVSVNGDGEIEIQPLDRNSIDGFGADKKNGPFPFYVPETISDEDLGAALREGFKRCTSSYK